MNSCAWPLESRDKTQCHQRQCQEKVVVPPTGREQCVRIPFADPACCLVTNGESCGCGETQSFMNTIMRSENLVLHQANISEIKPLPNIII